MLGIRLNEKIAVIPFEGEKSSCLVWTVNCGIVGTGRMDTYEE